MKVKVGRASRGITREVLRQVADALRTVTDGDGLGAAASTEAKERRARRAAYAQEALREQQEEGRRVREAYRRAQAEGGRQGEGARTAAGEAPRPSGAARRPAEQGARTFRYRGKVVPDYYDVLEVSPRARQSVVDKAYRTLMKEHHPDQGGDARGAQLLNEAYEVLSDPAKRREYDSENGLG